MAWVCECFTKNPNLKYNIFGGWGRGGRGSVARVSELFFRKYPNLKKKFEGVGGGWLG